MCISHGKKTARVYGHDVGNTGSLVSDRQLTTSKQMGPGFREISPHKSSKTDRALNLVILGNGYTFLLRFECLKDLGRRLGPWEDPKTNNSVPLCETFTKKSNKKARQQGAYITEHKE